jgi:hypothetical protein
LSVERKLFQIVWMALAGAVALRYDDHSPRGILLLGVGLQSP